MAQPRDPFAPEPDPNQPNGGLVPYDNPDNPNPENTTFNMGGFSPSSPYQGGSVGGAGGGRQRQFTVRSPGGAGWNYGWDFGAHQGRSYSYANPAEGAKYAFANYVQDQGLNPNNADAASIAAGLNSLYGSNVFRADGNRRVSYGDEWVDWSGQGKPAGEWFWGSTGAGSGAGAGGGGGLGGSALGSGSGVTTAPGTSLDAATYQAILAMLQQPPVTAESVSGQYLPVRNAMERQAQIASEQAGQRAAAQGVPQGDGSFQGQQVSMSEDLASSEGRLMAGILTQELQARRDQLVQAVNLAQGQERLKLQAQLQQVQAQLQQAQLGLQQQQVNNQNTQWWNQFGFNSALQEYLLNQAFQNGLTQG